MHMLTKNRNEKKYGFTIVELLIVVVVIAILASITIVTYNGIQNRAKEVAVKSTLSQAAKQLLNDNTLTGSFPANTAAANEGKGLTAGEGTAFQYTTDGATFCLSAINGNQLFHVTQAGTIMSGLCSGHSVSGTGLTCDSGYIPVPGNASFGTSDFCVAKYEAKNSGGVAVSQATGTPWNNITQTSAISTASSACSGCHLITEPEWMTIAANVLSVPSNWSGGSVGSGYIYSGHSDENPAYNLAASGSDSDGYNGTGNSSGNQRRTLTLSNGEVIWDFAGNAWEWTNATIAGGQHPGIIGEGEWDYKEWNNPSLVMNGLPATSQPTSISGVSSWTTAQGIGRLFSYYGQSDTRAFLRGGSWYDGTETGVLTLDLYETPSGSAASVGFRVAR